MAVKQVRAGVIRVNGISQELALVYERQYRALFRYIELKSWVAIPGHPEYKQ